MTSRPSRRTVAFHEAGHAVARIALGEPATLTELRSNGGGASLMVAGLMDVRKYIFIALAGPYAQSRAANQSIAEVVAGGGVQGDFEKAHGAAMRASRDEAEAKELFVALRDAVEEFVGEYWPQITNVAHALMETGRVEPDKLLGIVGPFEPVVFADA
jgi:hypothetical protein